MVKRRLSLAVVSIGLAACGTDEVSTSFGQPTGSVSESSGSSSGGLPTSGAEPSTATSGGPTSTGGAPGTSSESSSDERGEVTEAIDGTSTSSATSDETTSAAVTTGSTGTTGAPPASCADAEINQDETDVDCGGAVCGPCDLHAACTDDGDCASGWCDAGVCAEPACLADSDCDALDEPCADAACNVETKVCDVVQAGDGVVCEDGDLCTSGEVCSAGACVDGQALDCSGLTNVCGVGECDASTGACVAAPIPEMIGKECDDGFVCTPNDSCEDGVCGVGGPGFLWFEDFADPDPAWMLGETWQIDAAVVSPVGMNGADPAEDHSPGGDERLAGTRIGELMPAGSLTKTCLTTPTVDASGSPVVWLSFWRHLHTDYFPFAIHTIEAWDGTDWQTLETGFISPGIDDAAWKQVAYDVSAVASAALQVRVCTFQLGGAKAAGGWSIDDVTIGPFVCTPSG